MKIPSYLAFCWIETKMLRLFVIILFLSFAIADVAEYDDEEYVYDEGEITDENDVETRIIGGEPADIEDYPYQCSFIGNNSFFCGCFVVSKDVILTAAHCAGVKPEQVVLRVGSSYRTNGTVIPIAEIIPFETYDDPPFDKDIAIFKTAEPIVFSSTVQPIALPESGREMVANSEFTVAGWGRTVHGAPTIPERLMAVNTTVVRRFLCYLSYQDVMTDNMFCGGRFFFGGKGVCQGDSGGAAIQDGMAVGVVSFGRMCGQPLAPSVFADIASPRIREFIKKHTGL